MCYIPSNVWRLRLGCIQSRNIYRFFELEPIGGYLGNDGVKIGIIIYLYFSMSRENTINNQTYHPRGHQTSSQPPYRLLDI